MNQEAPQQQFELFESPHRRFYAIAFGWSWLIWIGAWIIGEQLEIGDTLFNEELVWQVIFEGDVAGKVLLVSLLSLLAVFGPMIGGIISSRMDPAVPDGHLRDCLRKRGIGSSNWSLVLGALGIVIVPPLLISVLAFDRTPDGPSIGTLIPFLLVLFLVQMITSGTEEFGWRGYLAEKMLRGRNFWDAGWSIGWVWAAWHYPVVVIMFIQAGMIPVQIIGSLAGFTMGIVAMSIFHAWFYQRTGSVFLNVVIHSLFNTLPFTIVLLYEGSPAALLSNLLLWAIVFYLRKREGIVD